VSQAKKRIEKRRRTFPKVSSRAGKTEPKKPPCPPTDLYASAKRNFSICVLLILLALGAYKAVVIFGAVPVPNPDYAGFVRVGRDILHFRNPGTYKRLPALGIMQITASKFAPGDSPTLTGSWMLNALFGTLMGLLLWLVAAEVIGDSAVWFAVVCMLNPWMTYYQAEPIAEITMIFFILVTFYFIFKASRWSYLFAAIASMVRYECSALIFIAFLMDMIRAENRKQRILTFVYAFLASVPFLLWLVGTALNWETTSTGHYLHHFGTGTGQRSFKKFPTLLCRSSVGVLFQWPAAVKAMFVRPTTPQQAQAVISAVNTLSVFSMVASAFCWAAAFIYGLIKRNWNLLAVILFAGLYATAHSIKFGTHTRYCVPIIALNLLVVWAGLQYIWKLINKNDRIPAPIIFVLQALALVVAIIWFLAYLPYLLKTGSVKVGFAALPYVVLALAAAIFLLRLWFFRALSVRSDLVLLALASVFIVSQHFTAAPLMGGGSYTEFKELVDWYKANAKGGEKLACTWSSTLRLVAEKYRNNFIDLKACSDDTFDGIVRKCYEKNITYVAWTPRGSPKAKRGLEEIFILKEPRDIGPFEFIHRIDLRRKGRWINIFRLRPPADKSNETDIEQKSPAETIGTTKE